MIRSALTFAILLSVATSAVAEPTYPVAVRWWGQGMVSVETYWNLHVVLDPYGEGIGYDLPRLDGDLVLVTHEHSDHNNVEAVGGDPTVVRGLTDGGQVREVHHVLDRPALAEEVTWRVNNKADSAKTTRHAVGVRSVAAWHDDQQGAERGAVAMFSLHINGVNIVHAGDLGQKKLTDEQLRKLGKVDVLCLPVGGVYTIDGAQAVAIIKQVKPRYVIPIHYKTDRLKTPLNPIAPFFKAVGDRYPIDRPDGNTLAVSAAGGDDPRSTRIVLLDYQPWQPEGELAELMTKMESACQASQKVFTGLSPEQLNWRPPNGTHTARWNAEHMMGRQLLFFSQIFAAIDPAFKPIDLNPKQMPADYQPAHPDWDGDEEARQMQRVSDFVRRYAYLLEGVDLDERAPGSRWTLRGLLRQMDRHYREHTANVVKKFELAGWPEE